LSPIVHFATPDAVPMDVAILRAFARWGCEPLGVGGSADGWSKMYDFQRCPHRFYLRHEVGAVPVGVGEDAPEPSQLQTGGLYHVCLALHYCRQLEPGAPGWRPNLPPPLDFIDAVEEEKPELAFVEEARRMLYGYMEHWQNDSLRPLAIESGAGIKGVHTSRYDMVAEEMNVGGVWITEHKSAFAETTDVMEGWFLDGEIIGEVYSWRLSKLDEVYGPLMGVIVNLGFKARPPTYKRLHVPVPESVLEDYARDRAHWGAVRDHYRRIGYWPRKLQGCKGPFGKNDLCAYRYYCRESNPGLLQIQGVKR
jgi:hypothetical protein